MKTVQAGDPKRAAEDIAASEDSRNLIAAVKVLAHYGLVDTFPAELGPEEEPQEVALTDLGQQYADDYDVMNDPSLVLPSEQEESAPEGPPGTAAQTGTGEEEMGMGTGEPAGLGLELSSFFRDVNDLSRFLKG